MSYLTLIGYAEAHHIGSMFANAARTLGVGFTLIDVNEAFSKYQTLNKIAFKLFDKSFPLQKTFQTNVLRHCLNTKPHLFLATGLVPPDVSAIRKIKESGIICINYLTDDPFNPVRYSQWFLKSISEYDFLFSPRKANLRELQDLGSPRIHYLPFAYDPNIHFPEVVPDPLYPDFECDVLFYGGADADRFPYMRALIEAGLKVHLYGNYWQFDTVTKRCFKGIVTGQRLRWAVSAAKVNLCLVRHANRDGHVMRTFELAAMGACMLAERTDEHVDIFGNEFETVAYFDNEKDLVAKAQFLLQNPELRVRMAQSAKEKIATHDHTYAARLDVVLKVVDLRNR